MEGLTNKYSCYLVYSPESKCLELVINGFETSYTKFSDIEEIKKNFEEVMETENLPKINIGELYENEINYEHKQYKVKTFRIICLKNDDLTEQCSDLSKIIKTYILNTYVENKNKNVIVLNNIITVNDFKTELNIKLASIRCYLKDFICGKTNTIPKEAFIE